MAPTFRSQTQALGTASTDTTLGAPTGLANTDILLGTIWIGGFGTPPVPTAPAGFTLLGTTPTIADGGGYKNNLYLFWKRALSESGSYTFPHSNCDNQGLLQAFSGAIISGNPFGALLNNTGSGTTATGLGITTTAANSLLIFQSNDSGDTANNLSPPSGMTEIYDTAILYSSVETIAAAGATGNRAHTCNSNSSDPWIVRMLELLAVPGSGPVKNNIVMPQQGIVRASRW